MRICLVTEELSGVGNSGGIGAAFLELAEVLAQEHAVELLYCPVSPLSETDIAPIRGRLQTKGVHLNLLDTESYAWGDSAWQRSFCVFKFFETSTHFDVVHFHDYKGLGFYTQKAKQQDLILRGATIVVQAHGPSRWTWENNNTLPTHTDSLKIDFLERTSVGLADIVISPSHYLLGWLSEHNYLSGQPTKTIKNVCSAVIGRSEETADQKAIEEIIFFGRHEDRKGFRIFCDALDVLNEDLATRGITVTFLGQFGVIEGEASGRILVDRSKKWSFDLNVIPNLKRDDAMSYIKQSSCLVAIPSPIENSPYTVLEAISMGKPLVTSGDGGARELIADEDHPSSICDVRNGELSGKIREALKSPPSATRFSESPKDIEEQWLSLHRTGLPVTKRPANISVSEPPKVTFGITHYERPDKLLEAVRSAMQQDYKNIEIVVVDDGSSRPDTLAALSELETTLKSGGHKLVRQSNKYLGAARNAAAEASDSDYICFLDDDDYALPYMVSTLVNSAVRTNADVTNCLSIFMPEQRRSEALANPAEFWEKISYLPTGGPLSIVPFENCLGGATALIHRSSFKKIGGFTELKNVGYEDYEFFARVLQAGLKIEICPVPLYFYETGRQSMVTTTSQMRNFKRVFDALEISSNCGAWRDLIAIQVGKWADEIGRDRLAHNISANSFDALISSLRSGPPLKDTLNLLLDYSYGTGAHTAHKAFSKTLKLLDGRLHQNQMHQAQRSYEPMGAGAHSNISDLFSNKIDDVLLGDESPLVVGKVFSAAVRLSETHKAMQIYDMAMRRDERDYLNANSDVSAVVGDPEMPTAFYHFENYGRHEGRPGFETLHAMCREVEDVTGPVRPAELETAVTSLLAEVHAA